MIRHTWSVSLKDEKMKGKKGDENQHEGDQAKKLGASKSEAGANSE